MREGTASRTARGVAARRLEYARVEAAYGDPGADDALARDVADGLTPERSRMHEYIRARTAFFDRAVVNAIDRGITQVVVGGAGYDGRALRYAKPGVRWFEVDHPATQADKLERLTRLRLDVAHIRFIPADFTADPVAARLLDAGLDPVSPALFLFEGVAMYLDASVNARVLAEFRQVTVVGGQLAISVSIGTVTSATRAQFQERVAALGEPVRTVLSIDAATDLLHAAGWELRQASDRQRSAGLLLAGAAAPSTEERARPDLPSSPSWPAVPGPAVPGPAVPGPSVPGPAVPGPVVATGPGTAVDAPRPDPPDHDRPAGGPPAAVRAAVAGARRVHDRVR